MHLLSFSCSVVSDSLQHDRLQHTRLPCPLLSPSSVQFSRSVMSDSLRPHELQHPRPPCPSPTPRVHPNPCPLSQWCHPTISSSVVPFSSCPQSFPASGSLLKYMSFVSVMLSNHLILCTPFSFCLQCFLGSGSSLESALYIRWPEYWSCSISPSNEYSGLISLGLTVLILLQFKALSRVFSSTTIQKHQFFGTQPSVWSNSHIWTWLLEKP